MLLKHTIPDAETTNPDAVTVETTPNEEMAKFKEWLHSFHPDYIGEYERPINMAIGTPNAPGPASTAVPVLTTFSNGATGFELNQPSGNYLAISERPFPADNVSVFFCTEVNMPSISGNWSGVFNMVQYSGSPASYPPRFLFNASHRFSIYSAAGARVSSLESVDRDTLPHLWMATFSTAGGCAIWKDGRKISSAVNDKNPFDSSLATGEQVMLDVTGQWTFDAGDSFIGSEFHVVNRDLSLPENAAYRMNIERFMMNYYGVTTP